MKGEVVCAEMELRVLWMAISNMVGHKIRDIGYDRAS
jgi:hypothetical protein